MELDKDGKLHDAMENSEESVYEICLLVASASGHISGERVGGLGDLFLEIETGLYYLKNWDVPIDQITPTVPIFFGSGIGLSYHERLFNEFAEHMGKMNNSEFEAHIDHCASRLTDDLHRYFAVRMAILACEPEGLDNPELVRIERFLNCWWGCDSIASIDKLWNELSKFNEDFNSRMLDAN